MKGQIQFEYLD